MRSPDEKIQRSDKPWMTLPEVRGFQTAAKMGKVSFFRIAYCLSCSAEIPVSDSKVYCSENCYVKDGNELPKEDLPDEDEDDQW